MSTHKINRFWWAILMVPILVFTVSCEPIPKAGEAPPPSAQRGEVPFETILQEAPLGDHPIDPAYLVITEPAQWKQLGDAIPEPALAAGSAFVGWDSNLILIAYAGAKGSSGYAIQIDSIRMVDDRWSVTVTETGPDEGQIVEPARTVPYTLVQVSKDDIPVGSQPLIDFIDQEGKVLSTSEISIP